MSALLTRSYPALLGSALLSTLSLDVGAQCANWSNALGDLDPGYPQDVIDFDAGEGLGPTLWLAWKLGPSDGVLHSGGVRRRVGDQWFETQPDPTIGASSLAVFDEGAGPRLYAGGYHGVYRYESGAWVWIGPDTYAIRALAVVDFGGGPELFAAGYPSAVPTPVVKRSAGGWTSISAGLGSTSTVRDLEVFDSGAGPELYALGDITVSGAYAPLVKLTAGVWSAVPLPAVVGAALRDMVVHDDGGGARLVLAYRQLGASTIDVHFFDGSAWTSVASPLTMPTPYVPIAEALASHDEFGSGTRTLFVGGTFVDSTGTIQNLARLQGTTWSPVGVSGPDSTVQSLRSLPASSGRPTALVVGGRFENAGGLPAFHLATWEACPAGVVSCAGDASGTPCPCGNDAGPGAGCTSSLFYGGTLRTEGFASVAADSLVLVGAFMPDSTALYFQGTATVNGGAGATFGDGIRCAAGTVVRLGSKTNSGGGSRLPAAGDPSISVTGQVPAAGGERHYQVWYRNAADFCTSATFNLTNGLRVQWFP